jgi:hypothetical protein
MYSLHVNGNLLSKILLLRNKQSANYLKMEKSSGYQISFALVSLAQYLKKHQMLLSIAMFLAIASPARSQSSVKSTSKSRIKN